MLDKTFDRITKIRNVTELKLPILFFALAAWVSFPILGIFPFLLVVQLDLLKPSKKSTQLLSFNNLILVLVILTISLYLSAFDIFADTKVYLDIYESLDRQSPFDNYIARERFEVVLFYFFSIVNYLSNESIFWCLFALALFNNSLVVFYISKKLSPRYYPTLLIILFSTFNYYSQVFYMRQFLSLVFVLAALVSIESSWLISWIFIFLAIFSHTSSIIFISIYFATQGFIFISKIVKKIKWEKRDKIIIYLLLGFIASFLIYIGIQIYNDPKSIYRFINSILERVPQEQVSRSLQGRVENNDQRDVDVFSVTIFRAVAIVSLLVLIVSRSYQKISPKILSFILIFFVSMLQILFILVTGFNQRIAYLFISFYGLFFCIGLDDKKLSEPNKIKNFNLVSALTVFVAASNTFNFITIQVNMEDIIGWSFFDKQPLSMSLFDYVVYFFQSI